MINRQAVIYFFLLCATAAATVSAYFHFRGEWISFYTAEGLYEQKKYPAAIDKYHEALELGLYTRALVFHLGDSLAAMKKFDEAVDLYKYYLQIYPDDKTAKHRLLLVLSYTKRYNESIQEGKQLLEENEKNPP